MGMFAISCLLLAGLISISAQPASRNPMEQAAVDYAVGLINGGTQVNVKFVQISGGHQFFVSLEVTIKNKRQTCNFFLNHSMQGTAHKFSKVSQTCIPKAV